MTATGERPSPLLGLVVAAIAIGAVVVWRVAPGAGWLPWGAAGFALWTALLIGLLAPERGRAGLWAFGLIMAAVAPLTLSDRLWPCATACQGGGHYQHLFGVRLEWLALAGGIWWALVARMDVVRGDPTHPVGSLCRATTWGLAGGSAYYLWVSASLGLVCPHCLAVHTIVLTGAILSLRDGYPWLARLGALLLVFLLLHWIYHPVVQRDAPPATPVVAALSEADSALVARIAANRAAVTGDPAAALRLDLVVDLHCPMCARVHPRLARLTAPAIVTTTRLIYRPSRPGSADLARHAIAAATIDAATYRRFLAVALGSADDVGWKDLRDRLAEVTDPAPIEAAVAASGAAIDRVLAEDAAVAAQSGSGTPLAVLRDASGKVLGTWTGEIDPALVQMAIQAAAPKP